MVDLKCVNAGLRLKDEFKNVCDLQICAFAQLALFSGEGGGFGRRRLLTEAVRLPGVDVVGSAPYVEFDEEKTRQNVEWTIMLALTFSKHLDFHLDYNIDSRIQSWVPRVVDMLHSSNWEDNAKPGKTVCLGHCTRLTLYNTAEWKALRARIGTLPLYFVGLPTSDLFMMGRLANGHDGGGQRPRATLQIPQMIKEYDLEGAIAINNIGNAFTPWGSCDPLAIASMGVGIYQAGTKEDAGLLFQCVSSAAKKAIGVGNAEDVVNSDLVVYGSGERDANNPRSTAETVYMPPPHRTIIRDGCVIHLD